MRRAGLFVLVGLVVWAGEAVAQTAPPKSRAQLDSKLLDDLFEGLERPAPPRAPASPQQEPAPGKPAPDGVPPSGKPDRAPDSRRPGTTPPGEDIGAERSDSPLARIASRMREVEQSLRGGQLSPRTNAEQEQIVADLSRLIAEASRSQRSKSKSTEKSKKKESATDSVAANPQGTSAPEGATKPDTIGGVNAADAEAMLKEVWGQLPARIRQQIQAPRAEQFLPQYERIIADYYRRLAEERTGDLP